MIHDGTACADPNCPLHHDGPGPYCPEAIYLDHPAITTHNISKRYRINVSTTAKGVKTYDCTVDIGGASLEEVVAASDQLVALLDERYPAPKGE